ncbi:tetratricopeptide repeat protein 19, mitochondrial-like [Photinus pyralis]|nr:tetratricopeptide repeat protein 19, mitochondrial-like [Photinus pyralis]
MALEKGDTERAEAILLMGLKISDDNKVFLGMPYMYDILASIALAQGNIGKAEALLDNAIEKMTQIGLPEDDHHAIDFKLRLARIYSAFKDNDFAEIGFKTCLEAQKRKITNGDTSTRTGMLYVNVLFWYGVHMIRNQQYQDAKSTLDIAYQYSTKIKGLSPYQELVILYTLSDLNSALGHLDVALESMLNAVLLGKGISSLDLPRCYARLARIYIKMEAYEQAKESALEAQKLALLFDYLDIAQEAGLLLDEITRKGK